MDAVRYAEDLYRRSGVSHGVGGLLVPPDVYAGLIEDVAARVHPGTVCESPGTPYRPRSHLTYKGHPVGIILDR